MRQNNLMNMLYSLWSRGLCENLKIVLKYGERRGVFKTQSNSNDEVFIQKQPTAKIVNHNIDR